MGDGELVRPGGIGAVGQAQRQQVTQAQAGQVLPVHEGMREPALRQQPGYPPPVPDPHGPVDRVPQVAAAFEPGGRAFMQPAYTFAHAPLQQVSRWK